MHDWILSGCLRSAALARRPVLCGIWDIVAHPLRDCKGIFHKNPIFFHKTEKCRETAAKPPPGTEKHAPAGPYPCPPLSRPRSSLVYSTRLSRMLAAPARTRTAEMDCGMLYQTMWVKMTA